MRLGGFISPYVLVPIYAAHGALIVFRCFL